MRSPRPPFRLLLACAALAGFAAPALAQHTPPVPFRNGVPIAPKGLDGIALGDGPFDYATGEGQNIRVEVVTKALDKPYAITFLPDGTLLVTEQAGRIRVVRDGKLDPNPLPGGPAAYWPDKPGPTLHGYMNIALHPKFAQNHWLYLSYAKTMSQTDHRVAVARATWSPKGLTDVKDIWVSDPLTAGSAPIAFGGDGMLYIATSTGQSQSGISTGGKVMRVKDDGSVPSDNPFVGKADYLPQIYTLGHRNILGMAVHPKTGQIWVTEDGPNGGDELNLILPGRNYGWPLVSYGRTYPGPWQGKLPTSDGYEPPQVYWTPAIAVSGVTFYNSDKLGQWTGDMFVGGMRTGEVNGTGRIDRILFNDNMQELRRETLLWDLHQRIRDVKAGPDGMIYAVTDAGALLRIQPR